MSTLIWAETEFKDAQLGDKRRTERLIQLAAERASQPFASIPQSSGNEARVKADYRFYENEDIDWKVKSSALKTVERIKDETVQDTTYLDYTDHPSTTGLGVMADEDHYGILLHSTLAVTPQKVPLGILDEQMWIRPPEEYGKRSECKEKPINEKESQKWLNSLETVSEAQKKIPGTNIVIVSDRESDIYDYMAKALELKQPVLIRAAWNRRVDHPEKHLWQYMESVESAGTVSTLGSAQTRTEST